MNSEKNLELYKKYLKGSLNVNGIELIPYKTDRINTIYFKIHNPNDVSYSEMSLKGWVTESISKFYEIIGISDEPIFEILGDSYYINNKLTNEINEYFNSITKITYKSLSIKVEHLGLSINFTNDNSLIIENYVKPLKATIQLTNGREKNTDLDFAIERYRNNQKLNKYDETEENYLKIDTILENENALIDHEWMVEFVVTKFENI